MGCFGSPLEPASTSSTSSTRLRRKGNMIRRLLRTPHRSDLSSASEYRLSQRAPKLSTCSKYSGDRDFSTSSCTKSTTASPTKPSSNVSLDSDDFVHTFTDEEDPTLADEIKRREASYVRQRVIAYDQMHAKSTFGPPLIQIRGPRIEKDSNIYKRVRSFETLERESRNAFGPSLSELRRVRNAKGFVLIERNGPFMEYTL
eukprot:TRINITY_DN40181_c0_g1_i1.p1 TRINITY_DN40181_c0_g1~~TRINITY_DN40181_c0_g1_i1.p1  ORF type:complete len:201 (+),score=25.77 TRINITY_DN40181_c0_g1_i1:712-1314(+)